MRRSCICFFVLMLCLGRLTAHDGIIINESFSNVPLSRALATLTEHYQIEFSYEPAAIEGILISQTLKDLGLSDALNKLFWGTNLEFVIVHPQKVMIRPIHESELLKSKRLIVQGKVVDKFNQLPLSYANIVLLEGNKGTVTNRDGYFVWAEPLEKGARLRVRVSYLGYHPVETEWVIGPEVEDIRIALAPKESALDPVQIHERQALVRTGSEISKISISANRLGALPQLAGPDIFRTLHYLPGISGVDDSSIGLSIRGGASDQNLVILDNITLYKHDHFAGVFSAFNADAISHVDVYKSAFPAKYGGRTAGIVNMQGKTPDLNGPAVKVGMNLLSAQLTGSFFLGENTQLLLAGRKSYNNVVQSEIYQSIIKVVEQDESKELSGSALLPDNQAIRINSLVPIFNFHDVHAKLRHNISTDEYLSFSYFSSFDKMNFTRTVTDSLITVIGKEKTTYEETLTNEGLSIIWNKRLSSVWRNENSLSYSSFSETMDLGTELGELGRENFGINAQIVDSDRNQVKDWTLRSDFEGKLSEQHKLNVGTELKSQQVDYILTLDNQRQRSDKNSAFIPAVYAEDVYSSGEKLAITTGLRAYFYPRTNKPYLSPRASIRYQLRPKISLKAAVGRYYQFTREIGSRSRFGRDRSFWNLADGDEIPVNTSTHGVLCLTYVSKDFMLDIEGYYKDMGGLVNYSAREIGQKFKAGTILQNPYVYYSGGTGKSYGWDMLLKKTQGAYTSWLSYSYGKVRHQFDELNRGRAYTAEEEPGHQVKWIHMFRLGNWDLSATYIYGTGRPFTDLSALQQGDRSVRNNSLNAARLPNYQRFDIGANYRFNHPFGKGELGFSIFNLLNRDNVSYRQYIVTRDKELPNRESTTFIGEDVLGLGFTPNLFISLYFR